MAKKKERRTPPPTMESIIHKAQVRMGEAEYKRSTDTDEMKKAATTKEPPKEKKMPAKKKSKKLNWGDSQVRALITALVENQDSYAGFINAMAEVKSEASESDAYIYESKTFTEEQIVNKANAIINKMKSDGIKHIKMPRKPRAGQIDFNSIYADLGLTPKKKK